MNCLDNTFPSPEENLACDEVLLDLAEEDTGHEWLRFWEPATYFVVVGYSNHVGTEVDMPACRRLHIPIYRRCSGGGTVLQGPGCLNYSLVLRIDSIPELQGISTANRYILQRQSAALANVLSRPVLTQGQTDLTIGPLKFAGNAQRRRKSFLLFHGCLLCHMDLALIQEVLPMPSHQPQYRAGRKHSEFIMNLGLPPAQLKMAIAHEWHAEPAAVPPNQERISMMARDKYASGGWNFKF